MDTNSKLISALDAIKLSTDNGWDKTFEGVQGPACQAPPLVSNKKEAGQQEEQRSFNHAFSLGDAVKFCDGKTEQDGQVQGRVVKQTRCYVWIVCRDSSAGGDTTKVYKKAKKNVQLLFKMKSTDYEEEEKKSYDDCSVSRVSSNSSTRDNPVLVNRRYDDAATVNVPLVVPPPPNDTMKQEVSY